MTADFIRAHSGCRDVRAPHLFTSETRAWLITDSAPASARKCVRPQTSSDWMEPNLPLEIDDSRPIRSAVDDFRSGSNQEDSLLLVDLGRCFGRKKRITRARWAREDLWRLHLGGLAGGQVRLQRGLPEEESPNKRRN